MSNISDFNKECTKKFFTAAINSGDMSVIAELISPDYKFNGVATTADVTKAWALDLRQQFPDIHFLIESILAEDDSVALRWRMTGTNKAGVKGYIVGTNILVFFNGQAISNNQNIDADFIAINQ
ncbi:MAG: ester cyclase [Cytophaga sp.]|nr:ester cyclase [Undibacterium sp.]